MITKLKLGWKIITYFATSKSKKGHGIHSPFVYEFVREVLNNKKYAEKVRTIEKLRHSLKKDTTQINFVNYGAGSRRLKPGLLTLGKAHKHFSASRGTCEMLYSLAQWMKPRTIIDLGTSFGFSTMYLCLSSPQAEVYTVEANAPSLDIAINHLNELNLTNYRPFHLQFDDFLDHFPIPFKHPLLIYVDGDHRKDSTIRYIQKLLPYVSPESCIAIADIYWSYDMYKAWREISGLEEVSVSIELLGVGILFFRKFRYKQQVKIRSLCL